MAAWEREKAFWATPGRVDTYELVHQGGYDSYNAMEKQKPGEASGMLTAGDWVRAEDYRAAVERLEAAMDRVKAAREEIAVMSPHCAVLLDEALKVTP